MDRFALICLLPFAFCLVSCSLPTLESPECSAAREAAREYYSLAIGGEPNSHSEVPARLNALRTPGFSTGETATRDGRDPYYFSLLQPTSYRVGTCSTRPDGRVNVAVTVIWRVEHDNSEREDSVTLSKVNDAWLIDRIDTGPQPGPQF